MVIYPIPVSQPDLSALEKQYMNEAFESGWISSSGKFVTEFESRWAECTGSTHALTVANGTVALHLALLAMNIGEGDEVIFPSLTYIASVNAIKYVGATPVFCDVDRDTWNIDVDKISNLISPKTKAIIAVHLYGNPCNLSYLRKLCDSNNIYLIEDAAEAPFSKHNGTHVGSFGDISTYSFFGNKIISSGEGGAVVTSNNDLWQSMKILRNQGMDLNRRYFFTEIGYNYRLTNIQCSLLVAQLERSGEMLEKRNYIYSVYNEVLEEIPGVEFQRVENFDVRSPWLYTILIGESLGLTVEYVMKSLEKKGIETRPAFIPIHKLPPYAKFNHLDLPNTQHISKFGLSLPTSSVMTDFDVKFVAQTLKEIISQ